MAFSMEVQDTFFLSWGTTFVGTVKSDNNYFIPPSDCEIVHSGEVKASFKIHCENRFIPSDNSEPIPHRSISTSEPIGLAALGLGKGGFIVRSKSAVR
jgi:hypothetical protein